MLTPTWEPVHGYQGQPIPLAAMTTVGHRRPTVGRVRINAPIGIFDSGFGGLTVARAIVDLLPDEDIIYLGDTARTPYGPRPIAEVREFTLECLDWLVGQGVKALVIACNTASSAALRDARERYDIPVIEVILPAARKAATISRNGKVGVICTQGTANSRSYDDALVASRAKLFTQPCPRFVDFVEAGITSGVELLEVATDYLTPLKDEGVDTLILGCTHYPLLSGVVSLVMGEEVTLVSSSDESARAAYALLTRRNLVRTEPHVATRRFVTTGDPKAFEGLGRRLMGGFVSGIESLHLD
ncbi:glutamate racemase [Propionibacterium sp. oral taxon 192 str. F0372]|nr:glutamate racemase [Propionibacterium sp. oral taxon 192 str. F0372]